MRDVARWGAWTALALSLAAAAALHGGVNPLQWHWIAASTSLASLACLALRSRRTANPAGLEDYLLTALVAWMLLALVPLPPGVVRLVSPLRASAALAARLLVGADTGAWLPLSTAPPATLERLLFVIPAMAAFVAAREMPLWWPGRRGWFGVAPVIAVAALEAALGVAQFLAGGEASGGPQVVSGTYVNRNHYAGLLEMACPLALAWAASIWTRLAGRASEHEDGPSPSAASAAAATALLAAAGCILVGVMVSLSRMGVAATLTGLVVVWCGGLVLRGRHQRNAPWLWLLPLVLVPALVLFGSTSDMVLRLGGAVDGVGTDGRLALWRESWRLFRAYPWTGAGLGTFEHALYPFRSWAPTNTVDFAHNDFLQVLAELGVIGFALAMAIAGRVIARSVRVWLDPESRCAWLGLGLLAAFVAAGLHALVDFNLYIPSNALALAWLAGVAVSPGLRETDA